MIEKYCKKQFLDLLFYSSVVVFFFHYIALRFSLYWVIDWYDIPMHFLGGFTMGILGTFIFFTSGYIRQTYELRHNKMLVFIITMMFTAIIGLAWELWELFFGLSSIYLDKIDTVVDLIMDMLGSLAAFLVVIRKIR